MKKTTQPKYRRILLKLSGEALMGDDAFGINRATIMRMVEEVAEVTRLGVEVAVVIGRALLLVACCFAFSSSRRTPGSSAFATLQSLDPGLGRDDDQSASINST